MGISLVDAARLARINRDRHARLVQRHQDLVSELAQESADAVAARERAHSGLLAFAEAFRRLRDADLVALADVDGVRTQELPAVEVRALRVDAARSLVALAGGAAAGGTAGALTFSAVGALATASTGTAISSLSGAAATSATLAWLGGGSLAAGGGGVAAGTTLLTGVVALPVVLSVAVVAEWQGRRAHGMQRETAAEIAAAESQLALDEARALAVAACSRRVRGVLDDLQVEMARLLPRMERQLARTTSYPSWPADERGVVATLVALALATTTAMAAPLTDESGAVTEVSSAAAASARQALFASAAVAA